MTQLVKLDLGQNNIQNISHLSSLVNLRILRLDYNQIEDIQPLGYLKQLEELTLAQNHIVQVHPLRKLQNLVTLELGCNKIIDIQPLCGLQNLQNLFLYRNQIVIIEPLLQMRNISCLNLAYNMSQIPQKMYINNYLLNNMTFETQLVPTQKQKRFSRLLSVIYDAYYQRCVFHRKQKHVHECFKKFRTFVLQNSTLISQKQLQLSSKAVHMFSAPDYSQYQ
ncbi:leucine-rich_repeat domain-containing protein [Hexamita inflata]|uniref:Leucine-rich repeat domain-containing protein n=1 Tax=Hexamita inflata TaxID=28002 RepID=A0AA86TPT6_9EUKA|nr:leucine-rich repeat domain-containing protein [Hexamita inflata]